MPNYCNNILTITWEFDRDKIINKGWELDFSLLLNTSETCSENIEAWWTKWNACDSNVIEIDWSIEILYDTARSPPDNYLRELSLTFPNANIENFYYEPWMQFCWKIVNGIDESYEINTFYSDILDMDIVEEDVPYRYIMDEFVWYMYPKERIKLLEQKWTNESKEEIEDIKKNFNLYLITFFLLSLSLTPFLSLVLNI